MTERPTNRRLITEWTDAERAIWNVWSTVGQDLSDGEAGSGWGCQRMLDAMEASAQQMARMNASVVRSACELVDANPFVPEPARGWLTEATQPMRNLATLQQHMIAAWFGMARQMTAMVNPGEPPPAPRRRS